MADEVFKFDLDGMTFNELVEFEEVTGESSSNLGRNMSAKALRAIVWIIKKRDNPDITIEEAGLMKISALADAEAAEGSANPTPLAPLDGPRRVSKKVS